MAEYTTIYNVSTPIIRVGKGSSKFFSNLVRSYIKNHDLVFVSANGYKTNLAIWIIYQLSTEYFIDSISFTWNYNIPVLTFLVHKHIPPVEIQSLDLTDGNYYIKIGKNSDMDTIKRLINKSNEAYIISAGSSCIYIFQILMYAMSLGYMFDSIEIVKTIDYDDNEKAGIKVFIYKYNNEMHDLWSESLQENIMPEMLQNIPVE